MGDGKQEESDAQQLQQEGERFVDAPPARFGRRDELAFKGDYEFLKRRVVWGAVLVFAVLAAWGFTNYVKYRILTEEADAQIVSLKEQTMELFGKAVIDKATIEKRLKSKNENKAPMPTYDAFDIVVEL